MTLSPTTLAWCRERFVTHGTHVFQEMEAVTRRIRQEKELSRDAAKQPVRAP